MALGCRMSFSSTRPFTQFLAVAGLAACLLITACGGKGASSPENASAATRAITAYLSAQAMEMKVAEIKEFNEAGDTATASASMQQADGMYDIKVTWNFELKKSGSNWIVESHSESR